MSLLDALAAPSGERVVADALRAWLPRQRWYAGKARDLEELHVHDLAVLADGPEPLLLVLVDLRYADAGTERYHVPLALVDGDAEGADVVARLPEAALVDAGASPEACRLLVRLCLDDRPHGTSRGARLSGGALTAWRPADDAPVRRMGGEQSNTSVVLGDAVLKVFRKLEAGENPDVELTRALTAGGTGTVPVQHGALLLQEREPTVLAVVSELVAPAQEGWELAVGEVEALAEGRPRPEPGLLDDLGALGAAVAATHEGLARAFGRHDADAPLLRRWSAGMRAQALRVLDLAAERAPVECAPVLDRREELLEAFGSGLGDPAAVGPVIRVHGDLHLGQVLRGPDGWRLLDFEGEPARPLPERREPHTPLKDVAGMLRSFDYAAARVPSGSQVENWRATARRRFLAGYRATAAAAGLLPGSDADGGRLLALMELDKATYELGYELANRPDWVRVPVEGILTALDRRDDPTQEW